MHTRRTLDVCLVLGLILPGMTASAADPISTTPGYTIQRLPLPPDVLPSCLATRPDGTIVVGSMDGEVLLLVDQDKDGRPETYRRWAGTLPHWPLGLSTEGDDVLIATRGALLRLSDKNRDGWAEKWTTLSDAWDVSRDHHDWTTGIARWNGPGGGYVVSPVTDDVRAKDVKGRHYLRGKAVQVAGDGSTKILAEGLRYPTGWANRPSDGAVFFTDNQGQQKTTCEILPLVEGGWYGYPSQADPKSGKGTPILPSVRIPYPWARSVNGLTFIDAKSRFGPVDGQLVLCEYNNRFILRASLEEVGGQTQGACYPFLENLLGPLCVTFGNDGALYVGSLREPAWGGEPEQGAIFRVKFDGKSAFGIREIRAKPDGFLLHFWQPPADRSKAALASTYALRRYHHVFEGAYHSPPVDEEVVGVERVNLSDDGLSAHLELKGKPIADRIYEIRVNLPAWPSIGHYTMNRVP